MKYAISHNRILFPDPAVLYRKAAPEPPPVCAPSHHEADGSIMDCIIRISELSDGFGQTRTPPRTQSSITPQSICVYRMIQSYSYKNFALAGGDSAVVVRATAMGRRAGRRVGVGEAVRLGVRRQPASLTNQSSAEAGILPGGWVCARA